MEVAVIGAGPAGSTLAALLARRGISVALIDRDTFPRDKVCGEFLSYDALPILDRTGVLGELSEAPSIDECRVIGRTRTYEFAFPRAALGVSRTLLDRVLKDAAVAAGARDYTGWTATEINKRRVAIQREENSTTLDVKVLVGAWGRWGRFDTQMSRSFVRDRTHRNFGFKRHYRGTPSNRIDLHSFRRGYLGVSPVEGGITNVCGLVHASRLAGHKGRWESFVEAIRSEERPLDAMYGALEPAQDGFLSSEPVIFRARSPVESGVVMIGDASGVIDPLTGNGMAMAIQSGLLAARFVTELVAARRDRQGTEQAYRAAHRSFFAPRIRWSRGIAKLLSSPALLDIALRTAKSAAIGRLFLRSTRADEAELEALTKSWFW